MLLTNQWVYYILITCVCSLWHRSRGQVTLPSWASRKPPYLNTNEKIIQDKRLWSSFWINTKKKQIISSSANSIFFASPHYLLSASLTFTMPAADRTRRSPLRHRSHIWGCPLGAPQAGAEGKQDTGTARPALWLQSCTAHQTTGSMDHTAASRNGMG